MLQGKVSWPRTANCAQDAWKTLSLRFGGIFQYIPKLLRAPQSEVQSIALALALVAGMTLCLLTVTLFVELHHVSSAYLIPVLIAATTLGMIPAVIAAVGGVGASAFFFYPPIFDFRVSDPAQLLDLPLFVIVAAVTGQLATRARAHAVLAQEREKEMRALYEFSRRLAVATDAPQIYSAIQDHLSTMTGCRVVYMETDGRNCWSGSSKAGETVPAAVQRALSAFPPRRSGDAGMSIDDETGTSWLIYSASKDAPFGLVAIDVGRVSEASRPHVQQRIHSVLADARATLDRLGVARVIGETKLRAEAETLRAALMDTVSHGLRTPLASIMGSASILVDAPSIKNEPRLADLAAIVRDEAERLDGDIQKLLDASRISSTGVRPHMTWADPSDIVNAAVAGRRRALSTHRVVLSLTDDLALAYVDPVLVEQALCQIIDNATKYSHAGSTIRIEVADRSGETVIAVSDEGAGLTSEEQERMFERFYRGARTRETLGSGLGLWIAKAFIAGCGGALEVASAGVGRGSRVAIVLSGAAVAKTGVEGELDD
jgi:two-component system, OmpR family, sensor histidine kinase KdpD